MKTWKTIPSWFKLDNYADLAEFTAQRWLNEIEIREVHWAYLCSAPTDDKALNFFERIKSDPLRTQEKKEDFPQQNYWDFLDDGRYKQKFNSVKELTESFAYSFLLESDRKEEIENDFKTLREDIPNGPELWFNKELWQQPKDIHNKYSYPISDIRDEWELYKFLIIDLAASDEMILKEFKNWLVQARSTSDEFIKRQFSSADFEDWYSSRLLPYWDLTTIATIEDATIPFHVLGKVLFPEEYEVDLAERIRKVTKKKCQYLFSGKVAWALHAQSSQNNLSKSK